MPVQDQTALAAWHEFFGLLGGASATLTGLLFVAVSVGAGVFSRDRRGALRMFLSASVVQFGFDFVISLGVLAPASSFQPVGLVGIGTGLIGLGYGALALRDAVNDKIWPNVEADDRVWYAGLPAACYAGTTLAGFWLVRGDAAGLPILAIAAGLGLFVAVRNAWDITVWTVTRPRS